jgi:excisionase family DNA binding protein
MRTDEEARFDDQLLLPEVADILRCSVKTVRRLIQAGHLASFKVGGRLRVTVAALAAYFEHQKNRGVCHV